MDFSFFRNGDSSTDSAADNVSLQIADRSAPPNSVPEPVSLALVTTALAVLVLGRRRSERACDGPMLADPRSHAAGTRDETSRTRICIAP